MQKLVTTIIPTCNSGQFITDAITSVKKQRQISAETIEIIIVDDGSTDDTVQVVQSLKRQSDNIVLCNNTRNKGPSGARNTGLLKASGKYVAFLDSDDIWLEDHLASAIEILESNRKVDVVFANFKILDHETGKHLGTWFDEKHSLLSLNTQNIDDTAKIVRGNIFRALVTDNFFHLSSAVVRRRICENLLFNEDIKYGEDRDFAIRLYKDADATFAYKTAPSSIYYKHSGSLTHGVASATRKNLSEARRLLEDEIRSYKGYLRDYDLSPIEYRAISSALSGFYFSLSYILRKQRVFAAAVKALLRSAKHELHHRQVKELLKIVAESILSVAKP